MCLKHWFYNGVAGTTWVTVILYFLIHLRKYFLQRNVSCKNLTFPKPYGFIFSMEHNRNLEWKSLVIHRPTQTLTLTHYQHSIPIKIPDPTLTWCHNPSIDQCAWIKCVLKGFSGTSSLITNRQLQMSPPFPLFIFLHNCSLHQHQWHGEDPFICKFNLDVSLKWIKATKSDTWIEFWDPLDFGLCELFVCAY